MTYLAILIAVVISAIAAYFSVLGLCAIFAASYIEIGIMATCLEAAKIIIAVWIHSNWQKIKYPFKAYLVIAVILLAGITSIGVFGFLSKAHIEQQAKLDAGIGQDIKLAQINIDSKKKSLEEIQSKITLNDSSIGALVESSKNTKSTKSKDARIAVDTIGKNKKDRAELSKELQDRQREIAELESAKVRLDSTKELQEADFGPLKYLSEQIYGDSTRANLDRLTWWLIIVIVLTFDPLALVLLMTSTKLLKEELPGPLLPIVSPKPSIIPKVIWKNKKKFKPMKKSKHILVSKDAIINI